MKLLLQRRPSQAWGTPGRLSIDGEPESFTLENTARQIPAGTYRVSVTFSPRFRVKLPLLEDVPKRDGIRIHAANVQAELDGCIAVGLSENGAGFLKESRKAMARLQPQIAAALARGEEVWIDVRG